MGSAIDLNKIGNKLPEEPAEFYRERVVADLLNRRDKRFPGAQPVSFSRHHFQALQATDYYLCEKTDGIRCLLLCHQHIQQGQDAQEIYFLIDRKNDYYQIPLGHLHLPGTDGVASYHPGTILDGELVQDKNSDGSTSLKYLIFDCLCLDGDNIMTRSFDIRLGKVKEFIQKPYEQFAAEYPSEIAVQPFDVALKAFELPYGIEMMFRDKLPRLKHGNDGLIFTCRTTPYTPGTDQHILKWKPPHENTIDFRLVMGDYPMLEDEDGTFPDYDAIPELELWVNHGGRRDEGYQYFAHLNITEEEWTMMKGMNQMFDHRIIECFRDAATGKWRPKLEEDGTPRFRDDKTSANHISVVNSVLQSIEDAVTEEDLIANQSKIRTTFKERERETLKRREEKKAAERKRAAEAAAKAKEREAAAKTKEAESMEEDMGPKYDD